MRDSDKIAIEEMARDLQDCIDYDEWAAREYGETYVDYDSTALNMVKLGYRKQGELVRCKDCVHYIPHQKPVEDFDGRCTAGRGETDEDEFCSRGARMKGGE